MHHCGHSRRWDCLSCVCEELVECKRLSILQCRATIRLLPTSSCWFFELESFLAVSLGSFLRYLSFRIGQWRLSPTPHCYFPRIQMRTNNSQRCRVCYDRCYGGQSSHLGASMVIGITLLFVFCTCTNVFCDIFVEAPSNCLTNRHNDANESVATNLVSFAFHTIP